MIINSYNVNMNSSRKSKTIFEKETEEKKTQKNSNIVVKSHSKDLLTISEEAQEFLNKSRNQIKNSDYQKENDLEQQTKYKNNETDEKKSNVNLNANSIFASNNVGDISTIDFECKESMHLKILLRI